MCEIQIFWNFFVRCLVESVTHRWQIMTTRSKERGGCCARQGCSIHFVSARLSDHAKKQTKQTYILFRNGRNFSILLFTCKLALVDSFKGNILLNHEFKNEATRANLQENKRILKWWPFWNKVCSLRDYCTKGKGMRLFVPLRCEMKIFGLSVKQQVWFSCWPPIQFLPVRS